MKIAVIDDNAAIREMLQIGLELTGYTVIVYSTPSQFFAAFNTQQPGIASTSFDLIIVDLFLPEGISGVELINQVKKTYPGMPAILISAGSALEIDAASKALPTVKVLRKPFKMATLLAAIQKLSE